MSGRAAARDTTRISHATSKKQFYDPFMETSSFLPAKSKLEAVARLYAAAQTPAEPLGPGSKEKKSVLTKTAERLSLDVDESAPKDTLARQILEALGQEWDRSFSSTGQTITLRGLNAILAATEAELQRRAVRELRRVSPTLPDWFTPARDKLEAVRRISSITGGRPQDLGPGSKERKSVLTDLVDNLGLPLNSRLTKTKLAEAVATTLEMPWNESCWSSGQTVTLNGLNAVLAGAEQRVLHGHSHSVKQLRVQQEARLLVTALAAACPPHWDGRTCVEEMVRSEYRQAKQTEWMGFYFEFVGLPALINAYGGGPVRIGATEFDYARNFVWDLKAHGQEKLASPKDLANEAPLNDRDAILQCVEERGPIGFLILSGASSYDGCVEFDAWHRRMRGAAPSKSQHPRRLKVSLHPVTLQAYVFQGTNEIEQALADGVLGVFGQGRQQSGRPRKPKLKLMLRKAREAGNILAQHDFAA